MALDERTLRAAGLPASLISLLVSITKAADRATAAANTAAVAHDLEPQIIAAMQALQDMEMVPGLATQIGAIATRVSQIEAEPLPVVSLELDENQMVIVMADGSRIDGPALPAGEGYDDTPLRNLFDALSGRVSALEGTTINRPPSSTVIPPQSVTVNTDYDEDFLGFFTDPDGDGLELVITSGALPEGLVLEAGRITGRPTVVGVYATTLSAYDPGGLRASRTVAWSITEVPVSNMIMTGIEGGIAVKDPGTFPSHNIVPSVGGIRLEFA